MSDLLTEFEKEQPKAETGEVTPLWVMFTLAFYWTLSVVVLVLVNMLCHAFQ